MKNLQELMIQAETHLEGLGYRVTVLANYRRAWSKFAAYCEENRITQPDESVIASYLESERPREKYSRENIVFHNNAIRRLFDLEVNGKMPRCYVSSRYAVPSCYLEIHSDYEACLAHKGLAQRTIIAKSLNAKRFLSFIADIGVTHISQLRQHHVYSYLSSINSKTSVGRSAVLFFLRGFFSYLTENQDADAPLTEMFPVILVNHYESLPSVYSAEELKKMAKAIDTNGNCACRDRAVIMLALQLGLRAGDIRNLKIKDIDWRLRKLSIIQGKTKKPLELPLPEECFFALLDYLKNERPNCDDGHVFVRSRAPHQAYTNSNVFYYVISGCFERAGVDTSNKHRGLHSLRHSSAVNMLINDTPYPVISGILGHENANTTKQYLRMDVTHLRQLALEVPHGC
jgi:integrase